MRKARREKRSRGNGQLWHKYLGKGIEKTKADRESCVPKGSGTAPGNETSQRTLLLERGGLIRYQDDGACAREHGGEKKINQNLKYRTKVLDVGHSGDKEEKRRGWEVYKKDFKRRQKVHRSRGRSSTLLKSSNSVKKTPLDDEHE